MLKPGSMGLGAFLDEIKAIGFPAVEIWSREADFEEMIEASRSRGLKVVSMVGHEHGLHIAQRTRQMAGHHAARDP